MNNPYTPLNNCREGFNGNLIVELGGMQITREQLEAVKSSRTQIDSDQMAVNYLITIAERAFDQAVQAAEYVADLQTGGDPYEVEDMALIRSTK